MAFSAFTGVNTYVLAAEDTAFGTPATPDGATDYWDKVTGGSYNIVNNFVRSQGIGEGRNATAALPMGLDVTGTLDWQVTDPDNLKYCIIGTRSGSGTEGAPYEVTQVDRLGYDSGEVATLTLEIGSVETAADVITFDGVAIQNWTLTAEVGNPITCSADWVARSFVTSTSAESYTAPTNRPFCFVDSSITIGSDVAGKVQTVTITGANNLGIYRGLGSRLIALPVCGVCRYDITISIRAHFDDTASTLSGVEARALAFDGTTTATAPLDSQDFTAQTLNFQLQEGTGSGDREVDFNFSNFYVESVSPAIEVEGGVYLYTVTGFALGGTSDKPLSWFTYT